MAMVCRLNINPISILLGAALMLGSCQQHDRTSHDIELLTSTPWRYEEAGFSTDDREDAETASFNALDPVISGPEKDNSVVFLRDGTGSDNRLPFTWSFQDNDSVLYFQDRYYMVKSLTANRLVMYADQKRGGVLTHYKIILKH